MGEYGTEPLLHGDQLGQGIRRNARTIYSWYDRGHHTVLPGHGSQQLHKHRG